MATTDRRVSSSRRGMTVLGKVPVVPKPINLPSQRLENQGLVSDVEIVPRGTYSWGSPRLLPGASGTKSRKSDAASLTLSKSGGECEIGVKVESKLISSTTPRNSGVKGGGGLTENAKQFSSANASTGQSLDKSGKTEEPRTPNSYTRNSLDSQKQATTAPPLSKSGDGSMPGFVHSATQGGQPRAGVCGLDLESNGVEAGVHSNVPQQDGLPSFTGASHHNGKKEREIIVVHMVGSPAFYGNYPPQSGYPDIYNRNGSYENSPPLQFGNFEPYIGFQGHGRLDGGAQISSFSVPDLYNGHEDFVCYEKECYHRRKKNGLVRGIFQESSFLAGAQRDIHDALTSCSSPRPRCPSQKHFSRSAGRLRSPYHNGRLVPIEDASAVPVPEKRITLLTKLSQPKLLSRDETGVREFAHVEYVVGSALLACGDEGKAPETFEVDLVAEGGQVEKTFTSAGLKVTSEDSLKEAELECKEVPVLTATCSDTCMHRKAEVGPLEGHALQECQACQQASVFESASKEASSESICGSNSTDGCAVEVKHVIFNAESSRISAVKGQEIASLSSSTEAADDHKQLNGTILKKKSLAWIWPEGKLKQRLLGKKGVTNGKWKPKRPVGAAKVDIKMLAPKMRKAAGRKNTSNTLVNEIVSEVGSLAIHIEPPMGDTSADSTKLRETETCNEVLELLLSSSLASSGDVPVDASQGSAEEIPKDAACKDCIASEGRVRKRKGKNTRNSTLPKDCHDNTATVYDVESSVKTAFEDISNTEAQKQEPQDAGRTEEKAWRPKGYFASQCKSPTKASSFQVNKADVVLKKLELQGRKLRLVDVSTFSGDSSKVAKEEPNVAQKSNSISTSQHPKQGFDCISSCEISLTDMNCSVSASKYHMVRRRVYHVVEGSAGDYSIPSATFPGKSHLAGKYRSLQTLSWQNQAEFQTKTAEFSLGSSSSEPELPEDMCMVEITSCRSESKGICYSGHAANELPSLSGIEKTKAKKLIRPGERVSVWKPKATPVSDVLHNVVRKKDDNKTGASISTCTEGESKKIEGTDSSSQVSAPNHLHGGGNSDEWTTKKVLGLPLKGDSACCEPLEEINHAVNVEESLPSSEREEIMNSQQKSEIVVSKEEVEYTCALKHVEEVLKAESLGSVSSCEEIVLQHAVGNCRPPSKKKNTMSHEKADRYHQMMFKKYKETGHWKPKATALTVK